jgi:hypothetical protein
MSDNVLLPPSPLRGGGRALWHLRARTSRPPTPALPHKGEGRREGRVAKLVITNPTGEIFIR